MISSTKKNRIREAVKTKRAKSLFVDMDGASVVAKKKACCICNTQLDHRNAATISLKALSERNWFTPDSSLDVPVPFFKREYQVPADITSRLSTEERRLLSKVIISPRTCFERKNQSLNLSICNSCHKSKVKPQKSIVNIPIGREPEK
jgi:hypothetical protein